MIQKLFILFLFSACSWIETKVSREHISEKNKKPESPSLFGPTKTSGNIWFRDKTKAYGLEGVKASHLYAVDLDNDGDTDLVTLSNNHSEPEFYYFDSKKKHFSKGYSPFQEGIRASYLLFYDFDKDGIIDVLTAFLNNKTEMARLPLRIYKGALIKSKLSFNEVKSSISVEPLPTAAVSVIDYDLDGWLDLYIGNWFSIEGNKTEPMIDHLNYGNKFKFKESTDLLRGEIFKPKGMDVYSNARPTYATSTCDMDQNGYPDVLTASSNGYGNKLWLNLYDFTEKTRYFQDYGKESNFAADLNGFLDPLGGGNTFFAACSDYNNDGIMDAYLGELTYSYDNETRDKSSILSGNRKQFPPHFIRTEYTNDDESGNWNQGDRSAVWIDINFDGYVDLIVNNSGFPPKSRLILFKQHPDNSFEDISEIAGIDIVNPEGSIVLDVNNDGKPDIITGQTNVRNTRIANHLYLFENSLPWNGKKTLRVYLSGKRGNLKGIGGMVILHTSKGTKRQFVEYSQGAQSSQHEEGLFFGLSQGEKLKSATVRWPIYKDDKFNSFVEKTYNLGSINPNPFSKITFCEDGKLLSGKKKCN